MKKELKAFWKSLKDHPGVAPATCFSAMILFCVVKEFYSLILGQILIAIGMFILIWGTVIVTAWQERHQYYPKEKPANSLDKHK